MPLEAPVSLPGPQRIADLLAPYRVQTCARLLEHLAIYLELLVRWNARTNLTAIREPERMVERHFGESLWAGEVVRAALPEARTILDLGSGAGFPGLPMHLARPELAMTLAESQGKKAAFLREAVRTLALSTTVHGARAESLVGRQRFDAVMLRAVDRSEDALVLARSLVEPSGAVFLLGRREAQVAGAKIVTLEAADAVVQIIGEIKG